MLPAWLALTLLTLSAAAAAGEDKPAAGGDAADDEEEKTLSQQIADGKYGLIQKELYATAPARPGVLSYADNPEVPRDTADTLGGLDSSEIWLAENHVLVLRGGAFPERGDNSTAWPPIDAYQAPPRQVKIPPRPKVPPPFPVQLKEGGPTQLIGPNGTALPLPPGSYFPSPGDFPINGSSFPPPFPYPPPGNGSFFAPPFPPPSGNVSTGNGPYFLPPFPGQPYPPIENGTLPPFFPPLPPGAAILPPPDNLTDLYDEDDPSIYYPPPYDFFYPRDNSTKVPPGPLVPGIILPPPPNFFAPLVDAPATTEPPSESITVPPPPTTVHKPPITTTKTRTKPRPTPTNNFGPTPVPKYATPLKRPLQVEITHGGQSPLRSPAVYDDNLVIPPQEYDVRTVVFPTEVPISYDVAPVTDIVVRLKSSSQPTKPRHRKPQFPLQYYELPRDAYTANRVLFDKPVYVLEYDSRQYQSQAQAAKNIPLISTYYKNVDNRVTPTPQPYLRVSPTPKASFYFYEEATTTTPRPPQRHYQLSKQLTPDQQYLLQQIANGEYEYEDPWTRAPPPNYYWGPTSPRPAAHRTPVPYPDYSYEGYATPAPPQNYHYQHDPALTSSTTNYRSTPRPFPAPTTTPNSLLLQYTRQDAALIDDITKKYFTVFGQKLAGEAGGPTTPLPPAERGSLHGDTLVNYRRPLPPVNPLSEFIGQPQRQGQGALVSYQLPGNEGAHVYFLTPRVVERQQDQGYVYVTPPRASQLRYRRNKSQGSA